MCMLYPNHRQENRQQRVNTSASLKEELLLQKQMVQRISQRVGQRIRNIVAPLISQEKLTYI